jgi:EAL and modified HD-GYP domain-containing signal transduction protein
VTAVSAHAAPGGDGGTADVVLARQPIFDADLHVVAYELLYRAVGAQGRPMDPEHATARVLVAALADIGLERLVGEQRAFVNVTRDFLLSYRPLPLPADRVVIELVEGQLIDRELMDAIGDLVTVGFTLALDHFVQTPELEPLLRLADIVKLDVQALSREELARHVRFLRERDVHLIAQKVETREELDYCRRLGFDGFQGYFFAHPGVISGRAAPTFRLTTLRELLAAGDDDFEALERTICVDAGLSHKLLRLANSAHVSPRSRVRSIRHALSLLGGRTVRRWASLLVLADTNEQPHELLMTALVRARFCELLAAGNEQADGDRAFTTGLFSVADALMHTPLPQMLRSLPFDARLTDALLEYTGPEGRILGAVIAYERGRFSEAAEHHNLAALSSAYYDAMDWADEVSRDVR